MTHDGLGKYLSQSHPQGARPDRRHRRHPQGHEDRRGRVNYLPVGSEMATKWYVEQILDAGCAFVNCIPVFIAREDYWQQALRRARPADHRRRHQEPGRRDDHAPRADPPVRRPRRHASIAPTSSTSAATPTSYNMLERERLRVQEDLQDQRRHQPARLRPGHGQRPRRPERLRAVADRPQVVLHPHGRHDLRRRAAEPGSQARSVGLAPTPPAWSSTPCAAPSWPWTAALPARSRRRAPTS